MTLKYKKITFIGMSGVGKSTFGKKLAEQENFKFIDTDNLIESQLNETIKNLVTKHGELEFKKIEENIIVNLNIQENTIISTGGSIIYSEMAMQLKKQYTSLFNDTFENIDKRIKNFNNRGIIMGNHKTLKDLYNERVILYEKYADITLTYPETFSINYILKCLTEKLS